MTMQELQQIIEAQTESQGLDFKQDCAWDVKKMVRDIIAMSNVRDGGNIVVGVKEESNNFFAEGMTEENLKTYNIDIMKDQLLKYTDPPVNIKVYYPNDSNGKKYVIIKIFPFEEVPIFSKADIEGELKANVIYYRNTSRRVESAPISNANDFRDLIEVATAKLMQRRKAFGFSAGSDLSESSLIDIDKISLSKTLGKIKSRGYWEVQFIPYINGNIKTLNECLKIVEKAQVRLDWSLPWIPKRNLENGQVFPSDECYESESEIGARKEFWRMYQTEQFILLSALVEDWYEEDKFRESLLADYPPGMYVTLYTSIINFITQVLSFSKRLCLEGLYKRGIKIVMTLHRTKERKLMIDSSRRSPFFEPKVTLAPKIVLANDLTAEEIISDNVLISNRLILETLDKFGYNPSFDSIRNDQMSFLGEH